MINHLKTPLDPLAHLYITTVLFQKKGSVRAGATLYSEFCLRAVD
jgi:hypothetical protein